MSASERLRVNQGGGDADGDVFHVEGGERPLNAAGIYNAVYVRHDVSALAMVGGALKLFVHLRIVDPGEAFGVILFRAFNMKRSKRGFTVGKGSDLYPTVGLLLPAGYRVHRDRLSIREAFGGRIVRISVCTVTNDRKQKKQAEPYSVVREVLKPERESVA